MQICTAQHLIPHLSVKVPSVGGHLVAPRSDVTASARQEQGRRGEGTRAKRERGEREGGHDTIPDVFGYKEEGSSFQSKSNIGRREEADKEVCFRGDEERGKSVDQSSGFTNMRL